MHNTISHPKTGKSCSTARKPHVPPSLTNMVPRILPQIVPDGPCQVSQTLQSLKDQAPHMKSRHHKAFQSHWTTTVASRFAPSCCNTWCHPSATQPGLPPSLLAFCTMNIYFLQRCYQKNINNKKNLLMLMASSALRVKRLERNLVSSREPDRNQVRFGKEIQGFSWPC